ncbi:RING-H2 finger protein ATL30-like [Anopheles albimanus]|uniref:RING-type domain-containing protein n=1 Tax=Anopheles albimanus TaxID=7167 RepID=A0A182F6Y5_ANOAL|nr:RING-H2 finger protein ATL30-like [Anopheles albimanus]
MEPICTVCYEPCRFAPTVATVCGHLYHETCVARWLETHATCPQCRNPSPGPLRTIHFDFVGPEEEHEWTLFDDPELDGLPRNVLLQRANHDFLMDRCIELRASLYAIKRNKLKAAERRKKPMTKRLAEQELAMRKTADTQHDGGEGGSERIRKLAPGRRYGKDVMESEELGSSEDETIPNSQ